MNEDKRIECAPSLGCDLQIRLNLPACRRHCSIRQSMSGPTLAAIERAAASGNVSSKEALQKMAAIRAMGEIEPMITRDVVAKFSLGEVIHVMGDVETPSVNTGFVTYEIEGVEGEIEITGPLAGQIAARIVERLNLSALALAGEKREGAE